MNRYRESGAAGLTDARRGKPGTHRIDEALRHRILSLLREMHMNVSSGAALQGDRSPQAPVHPRAVEHRRPAQRDPAACQRGLRAGRPAHLPVRGAAHAEAAEAERGGKEPQPPARPSDCYCRAAMFHGAEGRRMATPVAADADAGAEANPPMAEPVPLQSGRACLAYGARKGISPSPPLPLPVQRLLGC